MCFGFEGGHINIYIKICRAKDKKVIQGGSNPYVGEKIINEKESRKKKGGKAYQNYNLYLTNQINVTEQ